VLAAANKRLKSVWSEGPGVSAELSSAFCTCNTNGPRKAAAKSAVDLRVQECGTSWSCLSPRWRELLRWQKCCAVVRSSQVRTQSNESGLYFRVLLIDDIQRQVDSF